MSDEPKEFWKTTPPIQYIDNNPADELAKRQEDHIRNQRKSDELRQNPNFLLTDGDITKFLLQGLRGDNLDAAVGGTEINEEAQKTEAEKLRTEAKTKAEQDATKYGLGDEDRIVLEQLYLGFSQADLIENNVGYRVKISRGEETRYKDDLPRETTTNPDSPRDPNLQLAIRAYPARLRGKEMPEQETLVVSPTLWNAIITEFSDLRYISEGEQLRKSPSRVFARTAIYGLSIINSLNKSHTQNKPKVLEIGPVNEVGTRVRNFRDFKKGLGEAIVEK